MVVIRVMLNRRYGGCDIQSVCQWDELDQKLVPVWCLYRINLHMDGDGLW